MNKELSRIFKDTAELLTIKGDSAFRINAYRKTANILDKIDKDISDIYKEKGLKGIRETGIGEKNAKKIEEYIKKSKIKSYDDLREETAIRQVITHFFMSKGVGLQELKENAKKRKIIYSRFTKPAKQLLDLAESHPSGRGSPSGAAIEKAKEAIDKVAAWANSRKLDYTIETVFKKWLELDRLKPKEIVKKPFYNGDPMIWSDAKRKWYVISKNGEWLLFADKESAIEWKIEE